MPQLTRTILRAESRLLRRSVAAWLRGGNLRSAPAAPRAAAASLVIVWWIASRLAFFTILGLVVRAAGLPAGSDVALLSLAVSMVALQAAIADLLPLSDHLFGSTRAELSYLMVPDIESSALIARLELHLIRDVCFTSVTIALLVCVWATVLDLGAQSVAVIVTLGVAVVLGLVSVRALLACTLGRLLARPMSGTPASWLLSWRLARTTLAAVLVALVSATATRALLHLVDAMRVTGWSVAFESTSRALFVDSHTLTSAIERSLEPPALMVIVAAALGVAAIAAWGTVTSIRAETRRRYRGEAGARTSVRVSLVARATRAALARTPWASSVVPMVLKDLSLCLRESVRLRRGVSVAAFVYSVVVGIGWAVLENPPIDLVPFNLVVAAGCISAAAMAQALLPIFAVGAEGRNIDLLRGALMRPVQIVVAKALGMGLVVGSTTGIMTLLAEVALGAGWAEVLLATLATIVASAMIAFPTIIATAVFPRFEWRQPVDVTRSPWANLLAQVLQQPIYMAVLVVPTTPLVERAVVGSASSGIAWPQFFGVLGVAGVVVASAGLVFGTERLAGHLDRA